MAALSESSARWALALLLASHLACWKTDPNVEATAAIGEPCRNPRNPTGPVCDLLAAPGVRCLYADPKDAGSDPDAGITLASRAASFCAPACQHSDHASCQEWFPRGCCLFSGSSFESCFPEPFCEPPRAPPGAACESRAECDERYGPAACVSVGELPALCTYSCSRHDQCRATLPGGCCVDTQSGVGIVCFTAAQAAAAGISCG
ncbi:MAG: hypothetical protein HYV07_12750 [Deltaproteobacteria bacterium]|nr:hypothetical protein [Deltaproteobacteria bacterium]